MRKFTPIQFSLDCESCCMAHRMAHLNRRRLAKSSPVDLGHDVVGESSVLESNDRLWYITPTLDDGDLFLVPKEKIQLQIYSREKIVSG